MANKMEKSGLDINASLYKSEAFATKYKKAFIIAIVAIVVIILGAFAYHTYIAVPRQEKASTALGRGQEYFNQEMFDKALNGDGAGYEGFAKIADDFSGTDAANLANLYAGLCEANLGKWADAQKYLENYDTKSDEMVSPAALSALGDVYAHNNELDKAVESFKKAADMADSKAPDGASSTLSPIFLLKAGEILESQGKKDDALKIYQDIKKKYQVSAVVQSNDIDKYIERASTK